MCHQYLKTSTHRSGREGKEFHDWSGAPSLPAWSTHRQHVTLALGRLLTSFHCYEVGVNFLIAMKSQSPRLGCKPKIYLDLLATLWNQHREPAGVPWIFLHSFSWRWLASPPIAVLYPFSSDLLCGWPLGLVHGSWWATYPCLHFSLSTCRFRHDGRSRFIPSPFCVVFLVCPTCLSASLEQSNPTGQGGSGGGTPGPVRICILASRLGL
jgi:hypothetical protein